MSIYALVFAALASLASGVASWAFADDNGLLPPEERQGVVAYRSGGVGIEEAKQMRQLARDYPLVLELLAEGEGPRAEFTAGVKIEIENEAGEVVLTAVANGPYLLARLPAGKYTVTAVFNGDTKTRQMRVTEQGHKRVVFLWGKAQ